MMDYINPSGYERTQVALSCPRRPNEHGPMPLEELKTFITPTAAELKKATEGADCTFQDLEDCLPDKAQLSPEERATAPSCVRSLYTLPLASIQDLLLRNASLCICSRCRGFPWCFFKLRRALVVTNLA
eukprot:g77225.t1